MKLYCWLLSQTWKWIKKVKQLRDRVMNLPSESSILISHHVSGIPRALRLDIYPLINMWITIFTRRSFDYNVGVYWQSRRWRGGGRAATPASKKRGRPSKSTEVTTASPRKKLFQKNRLAILFMMVKIYNIFLMIRSLKYSD
jgi:hypothetical protein